ncbi:MAG: ribosome-associated translation inhibitor RaiA [Clostridia bacterium]|nr:ribosome-associated translation inhibitor RaiA [Clostridia bacterium]
MTTNVYVRKTDLTNEQKEMLIKKVAKLGKYFDGDVSADIVVGEQAGKKIVEVTIRSGGMIYRAEERNEEVYTATDEIIDSIERQIRKNKTRLAKRLRDGVKKEIELFAPDEEESEFKIVKTKTHHIKPMSAEEAILQMNLLGHEFFIFLNSETNTTDIVYRRKDGNYGIIETDYDTH